MDFNPILRFDYLQFKLLKASCNHTATEYLDQLWDLAYNSDQQTELSHQQDIYNKPMPWIGMYIVLASLLCILAMMADLLHGLRNRKLWFPCKYFTLNAASLTVIAVAIKLPMDLTTLMPGSMDMAAKFGSIWLMCIIMANMLPSIATMDSKELVANIVALAVLVVTLVVNICIQMNTGIFWYSEYDSSMPNVLLVLASAAITVVPLLMLLIIYVCSSLAILKSKQILESKYQAVHETVLKDHELQQPGRLLTVEKLRS